MTVGLKNRQQSLLTSSPECCGLCVCQVAGRLHVEVWRGTDGSQVDASGPSDAQQNVADREPQERKLDCVVRTRKSRFVHQLIV